MFGMDKLPDSGRPWVVMPKRGKVPHRRGVVRGVESKKNPPQYLKAGWCLVLILAALPSLAALAGAFLGAKRDWLVIGYYPYLAMACLWAVLWLVLPVLAIWHGRLMAGLWFLLGSPVVFYSGQILGLFLADRWKV